MTLVIKSDIAISGAALGDKHGIIGAVDWRYMLDFANNDHVSQTPAGKATIVGGGLTFSRASSATYVDKDDRQLKTAAIDEERIHYSERLKRNGLLIESKKINHFLYSDKPQTQNIQLLPSTLWVMAWVEGSGAVVVTGAGVSDVTGAGTQGSPLVFKNTGSVSRDVAVTVSGELSFVQVEYISGTASVSSKIHTGGVLVERESDIALVNADLVSTAFVGGAGSVLITIDRYPISRSQTQSGSTNPILKIGDTAANESISLARVLPNGFSPQDNQELRVRRYFAGTEQPLSYFANNDYSEKVAVSWGDGILTIAQSGRVVSTTIPESFTPDSVEIGGATGWVTNTRRLDGIVGKVVLYDRRLSTRELTSLTSS